jgi:predicted Zn-dependent peptidase
MTYFVLGFPAMERSEADRGLLYATSAYLGDDIDSLLFRELRRERALLYSIRTEYHLFRDAGHLLIKGVSSNENFTAVLQCLESIVDRMRSWSPTHETVAQLRHSLRKSLLLNLDDPRNKLLRILKHETWFSAFYSLEDDISFIEEIDGKGLSRLAASVFSQPSLLCYGA